MATDTEKKEALDHLILDTNLLLGLTVGLIAGMKKGTSKTECENIYNNFVGSLGKAKEVFPDLIGE